MRANAIDERGIVSRRAALDVEINTAMMRTSSHQPDELPQGVGKMKWHAPIENSIAERTRTARATQEHLPNLVREALSLRI